MKPYCLVMAGVGFCRVRVREREGGEGGREGGEREGDGKGGGGGGRGGGRGREVKEGGRGREEGRRVP